MSEVERNITLKVGLLLAIFEGWTSPQTVRARLGADVTPALRWLAQQGYVEIARFDEATDDVVRWRVPVEFESLWQQLIPERRCPVTLCTSRRRAGSHTVG